MDFKNADGRISDSGTLLEGIDRPSAPMPRLVGDKLTKFQQKISLLMIAAVEEFKKVAQEKHYID